MNRPLVLLLAAFALTACTRVIAGHPVPMPTPQAAVSTTDSSFAPRTTTPTTTSTRSTTTTVVTTPSDALFDPCAIVTWADFPTAVRPQSDPPPERMSPKPGARFTIACNFDNSVIEGSVSRPGDPGPPTAHSEFVPFLATIAWGPEMSPADLQSPETKAITIDGKPAALRSGTTHPNDADHLRRGQICTVIVKVSRGSAGVTLTNGRFTSVDACDVVTAVATAVARRAR